jgi:phenylacetate-CoA ligase
MQSSISSLLAFARAHSPFYRDYYAQVPAGAQQLSDYPVLDSQRFWAANTVRDNQVFTAPVADGITFKSGGTTGNPKYSVFTGEEWRQFTDAFGMGMRRAGLKAGDRVGNLFYAGKLYASFLFIARSIETAGVGICYPVAGDDHGEILATWRQFDLNVLAGVPTTLMKLLELLTPEDRASLKLETFLYGGEPMFEDQIAAVQAIFPGCQVRSVGVAGVDYGELGWASPCGTLGVHHCFDTTVVELLDDEGAPIDAVGQPGRIVLTNLQRRLMPVIRYPVGDQGEWLDPPGTPERRFRLLGRTDEGARIGPMTLYVDDIRQALLGLEKSGLSLGMMAFQLVVTHHAQRDACCLRVAVADPQALHAQAAQTTQQVVERVYAARPMFSDLLAQSLVHPLQVEWVSMAELHTNPRTGKMRSVVDQRHD